MYWYVFVLDKQMWYAVLDKQMQYAAVLIFSLAPDHVSLMTPFATQFTQGAYAERRPLSVESTLRINHMC